jgi:copper chaperone CopZ
MNPFAPGVCDSPFCFRLPSPYPHRAQDAAQELNTFETHQLRISAERNCPRRPPKTFQSFQPSKLQTKQRHICLSFFNMATTESFQVCSPRLPPLGWKIGPPILNAAWPIQRWQELIVNKKILKQTVFAVPMTCDACVKDVSGALGKISGIAKVEATLSDQLVLVEGTGIFPDDSVSSIITFVLYFFRAPPRSQSFVGS